MVTPTFTVISATYNVSEYLDEFLNSLEHQSLIPSQIILVNDGSTDDSLEKLEAWAGTKENVLVLTKENGGQSSARNLGLEYATSEWVTFADPDDTLSLDYFSEVSQFISHNSGIEVVATNLITFSDSIERPTNSHPLRFRYSRGNIVVNLDSEPKFFQMGIGYSFLKLERIRELGLKFDERLRPQFEDAKLISQYLLQAPEPIVGFVESAKYFYRRRLDGSSAVQSSHDDPRKFSIVPDIGYLSLLKEAFQLKGRVPVWLQNMIIYELSWFLREEEEMFGKRGAHDHGLGAKFNNTIKEITKYLEPEIVESFRVIGLPPSRIQALNYGYRGVRWHSPELIIFRKDFEKKQICFIYRYSGKAPAERFTLNNNEVQSLYAKTRSMTYGGESLLFERQVWLSAEGNIKVFLNGESVPLDGRWKDPAIFELAQSETFGNGHLKSASSDSLLLSPGYSIRKRPEFIQKLRRVFLRRARQLKRQLKRLTFTRAKLKISKIAIRNRKAPLVFANAWVFMDRDLNANDNGEHFFRFVRENRKDINAWFVISHKSPHWRRLRSEFGGRVINFGSIKWGLLAKSAKYIISSHADAYIYNPRSLRGVVKLKWKFIFLQHGVAKDDLSRWLNPKPIALMATTSPYEYDSIAGDYNNYRLTQKETVLTGLPRYDRLTSLAKLEPEKKYIILAPTWRKWLVGEVRDLAGQRSKNKAFEDTDFAKQWQKIFSSPELALIAKKNLLEVKVLLHPNLSTYGAVFELDPSFELISYEQDVQKYLASSKVIVTDYSSVVFDAVYAGATANYFQFDSERVFGGGHLFNRGFFSYEDHGFGPVSSNSDEVVQGVQELVESPEFANKYLARRKKFFSLFDDRSSERVLAAIEDLEVQENNDGTTLPMIIR